MSPSDALSRIQHNAREINALVQQASKVCNPTASAQIRDRAELIERETARLSVLLIDTKGNA